MNKDQLITIRDFTANDKNLIFATFLRGLYFGESWFSLIDKKIFMEHYHKVIEYILAKPSVSIKIACLKEDADTVLGYAIFESEKLHWVFVKRPWRGIGIAKDLVPSNVTTVTHLTKVGLSIIYKKGLAFNPFAV